MGENCTYKLCAYPEEENSPVYVFTVEGFDLGSPREWLVFKNQVKQVIKSQNIKDVDGVYMMVRDLLRGNTLMDFNNKHATFTEQIVDSLNQYLNTVIVHVFPNKAYKLQKPYIWYMTHKSRHVSAHKWINRITKPNNFTRKMD
eukprot:15365889-Ditylum_brightwellii.AAC.2